MRMRVEQNRRLLTGVGRPTESRFVGSARGCRRSYLPVLFLHLSLATLLAGMIQTRLSDHVK